MISKKLSMLVALVLSAGVLRADVFDLAYTKSDLAAVEKVAAVAGTCTSVYELLVDDVSHGAIAAGIHHLGVAGELAGAALEDDHGVSMIKRIVEACKATKDTFGRANVTQW